MGRGILKRSTENEFPGQNLPFSLIFVVGLVFTLAGCGNRNYYQFSPGKTEVRKPEAITRTATDSLPAYQILRVNHQHKPTEKIHQPLANSGKKKNLPAENFTEQKEVKQAVLYKPAHQKEQKQTKKADPDYLVMFLLFLLACFVILAAFTGIIIGIALIYKTLGDLAFLAVVVNTFLIIAKAKALTDKEQWDSTARSSIGFLIFGEYFLSLILGFGALAALIALITGWSFFWTGMALIPISLLLWEIIRHIKETKRLRKETDET